MYEAALIAFGVLLGLIPPWYARRRRLTTHWAALRAELALCEESLSTLMKDGVMAPLYRLPLRAYEVSFPILLADGAVAEEEVLVLGRCFGLIGDINRGLDHAADANMSGEDAKLKAEYKRNLLKATHLTQGNEGAEPILAGARRVIDMKLSEKWWRYVR